MKKSRIAAQLWTLRDFLKTPGEIESTLKKVRKIGYEAVQISGLGPIDYRDLAKMMDDNGLVCCASHDGGDELFDAPEKVAERLKLLNCRYTAYPWPHTNPKSETDYIILARRLDRAGAVLRKEGITLCYHNHAMEMEKFNGRTGLEIIYEESDYRNLKGEPDTYWIQYGGGNPVSWCKYLDGRLPLLHLKEYGIIDNQVKMLEIGSGNLNWKKIVAAAKDAGCEWYIVEQDVCRFDPFESLKMSFDYICNKLT